MVQISSSLKSRLSSTLIRAAPWKLEQGRFGGRGAGAPGAPAPPGLLLLKPDTRCLESKAKGRSLTLLGSGGEKAVMLCPGVLSGGGKEVVMPRSQMQGVFFILQVGRKLKKSLFATSLVRKEVLTCVWFVFLLSQ